MQKKIKKKKGPKEQVLERPYLFELNEAPLILSDELDIDRFVEISEIETEIEHPPSPEEEESADVGYIGLPGKAIDPVRIYLKEMAKFPLLTREGEVEIAKRMESGQLVVLSAVLQCPIA